LAGALSLQGLPGARPLQGLLGARSLQGLPGARSLQGLPGARSLQGLPGARSLQGLPGARPLQGLPGARSLQGLPGARSLQGLPGAPPLTHKGSNTKQGSKEQLDSAKARPKLSAKGQKKAVIGTYGVGTITAMDGNKSGVKVALRKGKVCLGCGEKRGNATKICPCGTSKEFAPPPRSVYGRSVLPKKEPVGKEQPIKWTPPQGPQVVGQFGGQFAAQFAAQIPGQFAAQIAAQIPGQFAAQIPGMPPLDMPLGYLPYTTMNQAVQLPKAMGLPKAEPLR
jgi:hypothetical protein